MLVIMYLIDIVEQNLPSQTWDTKPHKTDKDGIVNKALKWKITVCGWRVVEN